VKSRAGGRGAVQRIEPFVVDIVDLTHDGRGVARDGGKVVFVSGALPGERAWVRTFRRRREADEATVDRLETVSPDRVEPPCAYFGRCGGCSLQHLAPDRQIDFKQRQLLEALLRIGHVAPGWVAPPIVGPAWGYRRRARLGVRWVPQKNKVVVGFREREQVLLADIDQCAVLDQRIGGRLGALAALIGGLSIREQLAQIEVAASSAQLALVLRVLQPPTDDDRARLTAFEVEHNCVFYLQDAGYDSVHPLNGASPLRYSPDGSGLELEFRPTDFIQVNATVAEAMVRQAVEWLAPQVGDTLLELFAGLGNFSFPLALAGAAVTAIEGDAALVSRGQENAARLGLPVRFVRADLFVAAPLPPWLKQRFDLALLDPPRSGAREILPALAASGARRIVYVSCHPGTLARDAAELAKRGFQLTRIGVLDMFPHTAHVESMALFERP
jgi:23S rRNA (uracil1939-C5)-methyltransferase